MSLSFPSPTVTRVYSYPISFPLASTRFYCKAWWTCRSTGRQTWRDRSDCLVAPDEPFSVVTPKIRHDLDLVVHPEPRWTDAVPDWQDIPCQIGRVELWLPIQGPPPVRPFSLLVLLPRRNVLPALPYVYLGAQFILEHRGRLLLDCSAGTAEGSRGQMVFP